jgi:hypothetical protein
VNEPLYDQTLSDLLLSARRGAERAEARAALAARRAAEREDEVRQQAALEIARVHRLAVARAAEVERKAALHVDAVRRQADHDARQERVRRAIVAELAEERVRHALADVPPLPALAGRTVAVDGPVEEVEPEAPPVPSMAELLKPSPGVTRFLDTLLGPSGP